MAKQSEIKPELKYTKDHEWVRVEGNRATIGITDYAQDALTDVVYAELPEVGEEFKAHDSLGVVESVKSVSDIFSPVSGKIVAVNTELDDSPDLMNSDPYGKGWFCVIELSNPKEIEGLLSADAYRQFLETTAH
ncbi:MAG TPA: glycine cleavage system protein GcvH [Candidatus Thermoplasmatota archaeon]|nr:glycine cleavage system protein GcvH [Candidatus Thermoplasmatota archaeon]